MRRGQSLRLTKNEGSAMKLRVLAVACAVAYLVGCGSSSSGPSTQLSGVAASGAPLVGVPVSVTDSVGFTVQSAPTDANGHYSVNLPNSSGPYVLTVPALDSDGTPVLLSSVLASAPVGTNTAANLNPLTTLATQRALGMSVTGLLSRSQMKAISVSAASISQAEQDVANQLLPALTTLNVPAASYLNPIGSSYQANTSDPLDNFFSLVHFTVHSSEVSVGYDSNHVVVYIPATGNLPASSPITSGAATAVATLNTGSTTTPIQHVIVVVGENQTFDGLYGAYKAPTGQTVKNLLSEGIINADGTPGPNFALAQQNQAGTQTSWGLNPARTTAYATLPQPEQEGILNPATFQYGTGVADTRFPANLPDGPFQITKYVPYGITASAQVRTGDPVHRFFQMWQQTNGSNSQPDLFTWVATTTGQGGDTTGITAANPSQGGELMGFMNMSAGDAPYFNSLAQTYALADNYHQSVMGGTGANFFSIATGDLPVFNTGGTPGVPFSNQIENPTPASGSTNFYQHDGYEGGSYVDCSDPTQPGISPILALLQSENIASNCVPGNYYLVNNYGLGYDMNGNVQPVSANNYTLPPQTVPTIAEALQAKGVSWKWYSGARQASDVQAEATELNAPVAYVQSLEYNAIGDPLVASSNVMTNTALSGKLTGLTGFFTDVATSSLPAVSYVVPYNSISGHPGYSAPAYYEAFLTQLIGAVQSNPTLWAHTAILVTTDEGGGHFDTGYIQTQDFFGDGTRIPMLVVSPYARQGAVDHTYYDHASVLKFIEHNWRLQPLSNRSRDNKPNPVATGADPYRPVNNSAVGDLMAMFNF